MMWVYPTIISAIKRSRHVSHHPLPSPSSEVGNASVTSECHLTYRSGRGAGYPRENGVTPHGSFAEPQEIPRILAGLHNIPTISRNETVIAELSNATTAKTQSAIDTPPAAPVDATGSCSGVAQDRARAADLGGEVAGRPAGGSPSATGGDRQHGDAGTGAGAAAPALLAEPAPPRFNPALAAEGARLVEAAAGPGTRAAVAHWLEQDARRQQQAHRAVRVLEALRRASVFRPCETAFRADWDSAEDARFVFDALRERGE